MRNGNIHSEIFDDEFLAQSIPLDWNLVWIMWKSYSLPQVGGTHALLKILHKGEKAINYRMYCVIDEDYG